MSEKTVQDMLQDAELRLLSARIEKEIAERSRIEKEELEISERLNHQWWHIKLSALIQALVGGVVAGALIGGFLLDHFLKVSDLIQKQQKELKDESSRNLKKLEGEREKNDKQLFELNSKLKTLAESNDSLTAQLSRFEEEKQKELERLESLVEKKEFQLTQLEIANNSLAEVKAEKARAEARIQELSKSIDVIHEASLKAESRSVEISIQRITNDIRNNIWQLDHSDPARRDYLYQFEAGGEMKFAPPEETEEIEWWETRMSWRIEDNVLIIEGGRNPVSRFLLASVRPDAGKINGETSYQGKEYESVLIKVKKL